MKGSIIILASVLMVLVGSWDGYKQRVEAIGFMVPAMGYAVIGFGAVATVPEKDD